MTTDWQPIETAPQDGTMIEIAWIVRGRVEEGPYLSWWNNGEWNNHWTPTHWRPKSDPR